MEDSEKRRERLKAMRTIAAQSEASNNFEIPGVTGFLANPLLESPATLPVQEESGATPRFDFYTDPMAAFSGNKKRNAQGTFMPPSNNSSSMPRFPSPRPGPRNPKMTASPAHQMQNKYSPAHQMQSNYSPNQRVYQEQVPFHYAPLYRSPRGMASPFPMLQGTPEIWNGSGGASYYSSSPNRGMPSPYPIYQGNPGFGPAGSPSSNYGRGKSHWLGNCPSPGSGRGGSPASSGRGQGQWQSNAHFGQKGGRGRGFHSHDSTPHKALAPECFYHNSMVEDPWQHLEPVLWRGLDDPVNNSNTPGSSNSWLPKSVSMKKPRASEPSSNSSSRQSLAEYLAASFNEAVNDSPSV